MGLQDSVPLFVEQDDAGKWQNTNCGLPAFQEAEYRYEDALRHLGYYLVVTYAE